MAGVSTGGSGQGGKKSVDSEIPLIPFIDLLLCCVMFLLVTAVWNKMASMEANLPGGTPESEIVTPQPLTLPLTVLIDHDGYRLFTELGDETRIPLGDEGAHDTVALRENLERRMQLDPNEHRVLVTADDGIRYASVVRAMDVFAGTGFDSVSVSGDF